MAISMQGKNLFFKNHTYLSNMHQKKKKKENQNLHSISYHSMEKVQAIWIFNLLEFITVFTTNEFHVCQTSFYFSAMLWLAFWKLIWTGFSHLDWIDMTVTLKIKQLMVCVNLWFVYIFVCLFGGFSVNIKYAYQPPSKMYSFFRLLNKFYVWTNSGMFLFDII